MGWKNNLIINIHLNLEMIEFIIQYFRDFGVIYYQEK